jgi:hypothetical protein
MNPCDFNKLRLAFTMHKGKEGEETESTLRIQRSTEGTKVIFAPSGRIEVEDVAELQRLLQSEVGDYGLVLDFKDVKLVNRDAVKFLAQYEAGGAKLKNGPAYIREWITREREASNKGKGEEPGKV